MADGARYGSIRGHVRVGPSRVLALALIATFAAATAVLAALAAPTAVAAPAAPATIGASAQVPDYAREDRWAAQVAPDIVAGDVVWLATPSRPRVFAIYTTPAGKRARFAVIVVHGMGVNPDWGVVGVLRSALADDGFATLSVQMPVLAADAPRSAYEGIFPQADERLAAAYTWLAHEGYTSIAVVSHSLGSAMVNAWLALPQPATIGAWVPIGMPVPFAQRPREPVLDVVAEHDLAEVLASAPARAAALETVQCSRQIRVDKADHFFERSGKALAGTIAAFLGEALGGRCTTKPGASSRPKR